MDVVREWTTPRELELIRAKNHEYGESGCCATHDFFDASIAMELAWRRTFGRAVDMDSELDVATWNAAWTMARRNDLTAKELE